MRGAREDELRWRVRANIVDVIITFVWTWMPAATALAAAGHTLVEISPPDMARALVLGARLLNADGCATIRGPMRAGEWQDPGAAQLARLMGVPHVLSWAYALWVRYVRRDALWASSPGPSGRSSLIFSCSPRWPWVGSLPRQSP